jgi:uncharacterized protein (TIGR03437 family)
MQAVHHCRSTEKSDFLSALATNPEQSSSAQPLAAVFSEEMNTVKVLSYTLRQLTPAVGCLVWLSLMLSYSPGGAGALSAFAQGGVTVTNAAVYTKLTLTANGIATAFGTFTTSNGQGHVATSLPLPKTLGGVSATVNGVAAELLYAGPTQINFIVPGTTQAGAATIVVTSSDTTTKSGTFNVVAADPGIFTSNFTGEGAAAGETTVDGVAYSLTGNSNGTPRDIMLEAGTNARPTYLVLYGTGIRNAQAANPSDTNGVAEAVKVTIQGVPAQVTYAGAQGGGAPGSFAGLDQINLIIPKELAGLGVVNVQVSIINQNGTVLTSANRVTISLGGAKPVIRAEQIEAGVTYNGSLTAEDQVEQDTQTGQTFFFDAFRFKATPGMSVEIDLRSSQFDPLVILRRIEPTRLNFFALDDQGGGYALINNTTFLQANNNALLLATLPDDAEYVIFVSSAGANETGNYTVRMTTGRVIPIAYGATVQGQITTSDVQVQSGIYLDAYTLKITQGDRVRITMRSSQFDSFLTLRSLDGDYSGELIAYDDHGGGNSTGGTDAQIELPLPAGDPQAGKVLTGTYVIVATPFEPNVTGSYTLTVTKLSQAQGGETESAVEVQPVFPRRRMGDGEEARRKASGRFTTRRPIQKEE